MLKIARLLVVSSSSSDANRSSISASVIRSPESIDSSPNHALLTDYSSIQKDPCRLP